MGLQGVLTWQARCWSNRCAHTKCTLPRFAWRYGDILPESHSVSPESQTLSVRLATTQLHDSFSSISSLKLLHAELQMLCNNMRVCTNLQGPAMLHEVPSNVDRQPHGQLLASLLQPQETLSCFLSLFTFFAEVGKGVAI